MKNSEYFSADELQERWQLKPIDLLKLVREKRINWFMEEDFFPPEAKTGSDPDLWYLWLKRKYTKKFQTESFLLGNLHFLFFKKEDVEKFERENPNYILQSVTENANHVSKQHQQARERCREVASRLLKENPKLMIHEALIHEDMIPVSKKENGKYYGDDTIRGYIKDLFPKEARKPGRRPKN